MPERFSPHMAVQVGSLADLDGYLLQPPIAIPITAETINAESSAALQGARYHPSTGYALGRNAPKLQGTYISGTGSRTGRAFNVISGTAKDDSKSPTTKQYRILFQDGSNGQTFECVSADTTPRIENAEIIIGRGMSPVGLTTPNASNFNAYLHFAYGSQTDYRLALESANPIRLDLTTDGGATWRAVAQSRDLRSTENYLRANDHRVVIHVIPVFEHNLLCVEIGNGDQLIHALEEGQLDQPQNGSLLPHPGKIRLVGSNGWCTFEYYPQRHEALNVQSSVRDFGTQVPNAGSAFVVYNNLTQTPASQTTQTSVKTDGQKFQVTATAQMPDAGDGLGSADPARLSDVTLIVPAKWQFGVDGDADGNTQYLPGIATHEKQVFDDIQRCGITTAEIICQNWDNRFTGAVGHAALALTATNGAGPWYPRMRGIAGVGEQGIRFYGDSASNLMALACQDKSWQLMQIPLGLEVDFDGWPLFNAIKFLLSTGNIHPYYQSALPSYTPPGAPDSDPYGPAGADCPYPVLARGTGLNARFRYTPERLIWSILQELVMDHGQVDPLTNRNVPYYMAFDAQGQFFFSPFDPFQQDPAMFYSDVDVSGDGLIQNLEVINSIEQLRTVVDFQGVDGQTNELITYHQPTSPIVQRLVG